MRSECAVLVPVATVIEPECQAALDILKGRGYDIITFRGCSQVDQARSELATMAMDAGYLETLWVDSDIVFKPDDVEKLRKHNLPMTAGLYTRKGDPSFAAKFLHPGRIVFGLSGGLLEVEYVGMGFVHVRRQVYEQVEKMIMLPRCSGSHTGKPVIPYFAPSVAPTGQGWVYLADDYSFCHRVKDAGIKIIAETTIKLGHIGKRAYCWDDFALQQYDELEFNIPAA